MNFGNRNRGRVAKAAGDSFEKWADAQHEAARILGALVHVAHNQPQARHVGGRLVYTAKSGTDYSGVLADGRALAAEAKSTKARLARSAIKPKQAEQLDAVARVGGAAFLLVEFRDPKLVEALDRGVSRGVFRFAIPWPEVPWRRLRSAESVGPHDVDPKWLVCPGECYLKRGVRAPTAVGKRRVFHRE